MDNRKAYFITIDTETTCEPYKTTFTHPLIYDFGFAIHDRKGNISFTYECIIEEIFKPELMQTAYYAIKVPFYQERIKKGEIEIVPFAKAMEVLNNAIKDLPKNLTAGAYNMSFDILALTNTAKWCDYKGKILKRSCKTQDIRSLFMETIYKQKNFYKFAVKNNLFSEKGNLNSSAEVAYRYMLNNPDYNECHTALEDVFIEVAIWAYSLRQKKKFTKGVPKSTMKMLIKV